MTMGCAINGICVNSVIILWSMNGVWEMAGMTRLDNKRIVPPRRDLFFETVDTLLKNLLIESKNYTDAYYYQISKDELRHNVQENATYIREWIDEHKWMIEDGV
jgi:hypothetical protein